MLSLGARRWWALGAITLAVLVVSLDTTVLSVALPTLAAELGASTSDLQWFSSGYTLALAAAMMPAGLLGDRYGRKKVLLASLVLFGAGSAACAYSDSPAAFLAAQLFLGMAGAGVVVMAISALTVLFTDEERPRAVGIWAAAGFIAYPIGPILGGYLLSHAWWGWAFLINVPVAVVGLVAVLVLVPESRSHKRPTIDWLGIVASSGGFALLTYGLIEAGRNGWSDGVALGTLVGGMAVLLGFVSWESRLSRRTGGQPLVDLSLFESASFAWGVCLMTLMTLAMIGVMFTMPQYFQAIAGTDAEGSGVRLLPLVGGLLVGATTTDRLVKRIGAKLAAALGLVVLAGGLALGTQTSVESGGGFIAAWMALAGLGVGITLTTTASAALSELSTERAGVGSGAMQAITKIGAPLGAAILGSVLSSVYQSHLHLGSLSPAAADSVRSSVFAGLAVAGEIGSPELVDSVQSAFVTGMDVALWVSAGIACAGCLVALVFLPSGRTTHLESAANHAQREGGVL